MQNTLIICIKQCYNGWQLFILGVSYWEKIHCDKQPFHITLKQRLKTILMLLITEMSSRLSSDNYLVSNIHIAEYPDIWMCFYASSVSCVHFNILVIYSSKTKRKNYSKDCYGQLLCHMFNICFRNLIFLHKSYISKLY